MNEPSATNADTAAETNPIAAQPATPAAAEPEGAAFSRRIRPPRFWRVGLVAVSGMILLISAALALGASLAPSTGSNQTPSSNNGAVGSGGWLPGPAALDPAGPLAMGRGKGFDRGLHLGRFGGVTITAIDGSNLSLRTDDGWTRTITVTSSTKITRGDQTIAVSDLKVGDTIVFSQTRKDDGTYSIDAVAVLVPQVGGDVTAISANGFTLKARDGTSWTITVNGNTTFKLGSADGSKADVKVGTQVVVSGNKGPTDTSLTALSVRIRVPVVLGQVIAKSGNTITIKRADGTTQTIHVGSGTTYRVRGVDNASLSNITVGMTIVVEGSQRSDGSIDATTVGGGAFERGLKGFGPGYGPRFGFPNGRNPAPTASPEGTSSES